MVWLGACYHFQCAPPAIARASSELSAIANRLTSFMFTPSRLDAGIPPNMARLLPLPPIGGHRQLLSGDAVIADKR